MIIINLYNNTIKLLKKYEATLIKVILVCILISAGSMVFRNLGHSKIHFWDEAFHAIVARNLTKHPLKFTLYDQPWLKYDYKGWGENHIWLHKPPVAMWEICISHFIFGINAFALRFPSAISLVLTAWLTYRIASDLIDKRAGLIAAFFQAFNPFLFESVHGYRFSDHIDIALLLWVQVSCWFLLRAIRTGKNRNYILSGIAMGIAYLSKSYLALITLGIAMVIWVVEFSKRKWYYWKHAPAEEKSEIQESNHKTSYIPTTFIRLKDLGVLFVSGILTVAPWVTYCLIFHTKEYIWEHKRVIDHLNTNVENWAAAWDRPLFEYMPLFYPFFYAVIFAFVLCLIVVLIRKWRLPELFLLAWAIGVIVPHTLAETKTPSATMIAVPPLLICLAFVMSKAWEKRDWLYTSIWGSSMLSLVIITYIATKYKGRYSFRNILPIEAIKGFAPFVARHIWIVEQLIGFAIIFAAVLLIYEILHRRKWHRWTLTGLRTIALILTVFYAGNYVNTAYKVTSKNVQIPLYVKSGERIQRELPDNACFFTDDERTGAHFDLMYYADRSTYQINNVHRSTPRNYISQAKEARSAGAIPYLYSVKQTEYNYPIIIDEEIDIGNGKKQRYRIYEIVE
ncbi:hypothetical protein C6497_11120 [Candidatus Poribacteria bacterium]|nr:MAG: hypothetical protein C6497_11120 [Candidatus Poribacteria bacterium]